MSKNRTWRLIGWGLLLATASACSLLVDRGEEQCASNADCEALGAAFKGSVCGPQRTCLSAGASSQAGLCVTNDECTTRAGGVASICRHDSRQCVTVLNADCDSVRSFSPTGQILEGAEAVRDDGTVILASLQSLRGANQLKGMARVQAVELAVNELMTRAAGLPPGAGSDRRRPVAVLSCNDTDDTTPPPPEAATVRSAKHLLELGVPAVIGAGNSGNTVTATPLLAKKGVLLISPSATSPSITNADDDGLLWRTAPSDALQALPLAERINAALSGAGSTKKLAVLYKSDAYGQGLFEQVTARIERNGKPIGDPSNSPYYLAREYDASASDLSNVVADVFTAKPAIIAIAGTSEGVTKLLAPIEAGWASRTGGAPRPLYIVSDGLKGGVLTTAISSDEGPDGGAGSGLRSRVVGTAPGRPTQTTASFLLRFESKHGSENSRAFGTAGAYDSAYVVLYALAATSDRPMSGRAIVDGITKLVGGSSVMDVGPNGINDAFQKLTAGGSIDLNGASSPLNFDLKTGESPADIEVWCVSPTIAVPTFATTALFFNASAENMVGQFSCE